MTLLPHTNEVFIASLANFCSVRHSMPPQNKYRSATLIKAVKKYVEQGRWAHQRRVLSIARAKGYAMAESGDPKPDTRSNVHRAEASAFRRGFRAAYKRSNS